MRTRATTVIAAALLAALTACSTASSDGKAEPAGDSGTPAAEPTISVPADKEGDDLEAAVAVYTAAYFAADAATAYDMLSKRCRGEITADAYAGVVQQAKADHGEDHPATDVKAEVSGELGRATYKVQGLPEFDQTDQPWTLEDGAWKYDAC
ncbi:hypothetical protein ACIBBD_34755 [Streptomyces sp. NPDC051315]|uniref:hypothetical protein n=1 Tax=Streptomyces sp. NPDC051315 TaxID=3365650 RepID=UPI0037A0B2CE